MEQSPFPAAGSARGKRQAAAMPRPSLSTRVIAYRFPSSGGSIASAATETVGDAQPSGYPIILTVIARSRSGTPATWVEGIVAERCDRPYRSRRSPD